MKKIVNIIFPHQLFEDNSLLDHKHETYLVEEYLFFKQYNFHKQKLAFHRASMMGYKEFIEKKGIKVNYIDSTNDLSDIQKLIPKLIENNISEINIINPIDNWLEKRVSNFSASIKINVFDTPYFINTNKELSSFFRDDKKSFFQTTFYKQQRVKLNILIDDNQKPLGGKWTYDKENRKKYPKAKTPPNIQFPKSDKNWESAIKYVDTHFRANIGEISLSKIYPTTHQEAKKWLEQFLEFRFYDFGIYEDAIVKGENYLNHSILSPLLNAGLLTPKYVINCTLDFVNKNDIPINSTEGFIRQIIGWREFIRGMYICKGTFSRTENFWNFTKKIPKSFYDGTTGIEPIDETIKGILKTGYCHHIERLMVLGNFMLLCEFHPDEVYKWFMELFIDAYDWVMVPNVYGMSQFADGGTFATKPYVGGSNYIKKMSNYPKSDWEPIWDGLFWRFIHQHQDFFKSNPRISMLYYSFNKMEDEKKENHLKNANDFLNKLH